MPTTRKVHLSAYIHPTIPSKALLRPWRKCHLCSKVAEKNLSSISICIFQDYFIDEEHCASLAYLEVISPLHSTGTSRLLIFPGSLWSHIGVRAPWNDLNLQLHLCFQLHSFVPPTFASLGKVELHISSNLTSACPLAFLSRWNIQHDTCVVSRRYKKCVVGSSATAGIRRALCDA